MDLLLLLLAFPLVWPFVAKAIWRHEITLAEMGISLALVAGLVTVGFFAGRSAQTADVEVWNGQVTGKESRRVSCSHSYSCNCRQVCSGSGSSRSCSLVCSTCYEHPWDQSWYLKTTLGEITVPRVDRRGLKEPERFTRATVGDPVSQLRPYENLVKGAPDSLFNTLREQVALAHFQEQVPPYPVSIYDLHYLDRVLTAGAVEVPDLHEWNRELAMRLRSLGPTKQANVVVVMTRSANPLFASAIQAAWLGGKKNDVVVVLGVPEYPKLAWARVFSWTDNELFKVQLRDDLQALQLAERQAVLDVIERHVTASFKRRSMEDFEYLRNEIHPPGWVIALLAVLGVVGSLATSWFMAKNDIRTRAGEQLRRAAYRARHPFAV